MTKFQITNSKSQTDFGHLNFGHWVLFGIWCLALGISPPRAASARQPIIAALEWEAETSVPSGYEGRALPSPGATVRVVLLLRPGLTENNVAVSWLVDEKRALPADPLAFRFSVTEPAGSSHDIQVAVRDLKTNVVERATISVPVVAPEVWLYRAASLDQAAPVISTNILALPAGAPFTFLAKAYFFPGGSPRYRWAADGETLAGSPRFPHLLTLTTPANPPEPIEKRIRATAQDSRFSGIVATKEVRVKIR